MLWFKALFRVLERGGVVIELRVFGFRSEGVLVVGVGV